MENKWAKDLTILSSITDAEGRMSIPGIFDEFMNMAAEHAEKLGVGFFAMAARRAYWVAVRTRVHLYKRPQFMDVIRLETWPGKPGMVKSDRFYRISRDGETMAEGRTEWVVQDMDTGRVRKTGDYGYPVEMEHCPDRVCGDPFTRFRDEPTEESFLKNYTVGSMDIDTGRHMNNVAYIRMLLGTFTTAQLAAMDVKEVEISYREACYEGQALSVYRRQDGEGWHLQVRRPDGITAVQAVLRLRT